MAALESSREVPRAAAHFRREEGGGDAGNLEIVGAPGVNGGMGGLGRGRVATGDSRAIDDRADARLNRGELGLGAGGGGGEGRGFVVEADEPVEVEFFGGKPLFKFFAGGSFKFDEHFAAMHSHEDAADCDSGGGVKSSGELFGALASKASHSVLSQVARHGYEFPSANFVKRIGCPRDAGRVKNFGRHPNWTDRNGRSIGYTHRGEKSNGRNAKSTSLLFV